MSNKQKIKNINYVAKTVIEKSSEDIVELTNVRD